MYPDDDLPAVHAGNYYTTGVKRILAKLAATGIAIPKEALAVPKHEGFGKPFAEFTQIEHAMLDWFEDRDYALAQALIHHRPPRDEWQVIYVLDEEKKPFELSHGMLCPTRLDAVAAVVFACDRDTVRLEACQKDGAALVIVIGGSEVLRIEPVTIEPFDRAARDRVRLAFKGVRRDDQRAILLRAARLPGFADCAFAGEVRNSAEDVGLFFGFPGNWALAMRNALKQVGISVKQSQAQELAAVFFGASHWHQLVKHADVPNDGMESVAVTCESPTGPQYRFYRTPEEALFAVGTALKQSSDPVVIQHLDLSLDKRRAVFWATPRRVFEASTPENTYQCAPCIECGANDYWDVEGHGTPAQAEAAARLLATLERAQAPASTLGVLYDRNDPAGLLEGLLQRDGLSADHLIYLGGHALAVFYVPEPNGGSLLTAQMRIYKIAESGPPRQLASVAMYKAEVVVEEMVGGCKLVIRPDYGKDEPIEIATDDLEQVERLLALTHSENLFWMEAPRRHTAEPRSLH